MVTLSDCANRPEISGEFNVKSCNAHWAWCVLNWQQPAPHNNGVGSMHPGNSTKDLTYWFSLLTFTINYSLLL